MLKRVTRDMDVKGLKIPGITLNLRRTDDSDVH